MSFRLLWSNAQASKDHGDQTARLSFSLPPGAARPELTDGCVPTNPDVSGDQFLRIRIQVNEKGEPKNVAILEATDKDWGKKALRVLRPGACVQRWLAGSVFRWRASSS